MKGLARLVLIPLFYVAVAGAGRAFTAEGVPGWYGTLTLPPWTPSGAAIGIVWTVIYVLTAISFVLFAVRGSGRATFRPVACLYIANGVINALWSYVFFVKHWLGPAVVHAGAIAATVGVIMVLARPVSRAASLLLMPYLGWSAFATYLAWRIYELN
jgi:tryptophan-rich sensory protein